MSLEDRLAELTAALNANTAALTGTAPAAAKPVGRPRKAETPVPPTPAPTMPAAAPAAQAPAPVAAPATARQPTADTAQTVTPAQIKAAGDDLTLLANELGQREIAVGILAEFGVQKMTAMPPANIPEFHAKIKAAIARVQPPAAAASPSLV